MTTGWGSALAVQALQSWGLTAAQHPPGMLTPLTHCIHSASRARGLNRWPPHESRLVSAPCWLVWVPRNCRGRARVTHRPLGNGQAEGGERRSCAKYLVEWSGPAAGRIWRVCNSVVQVTPARTCVSFLTFSLSLRLSVPSKGGP